MKKCEKKFAIWPTKMTDGTWVWFKSYYEVRYTSIPGGGTGFALLLQRTYVKKFKDKPNSY